MPFTKQELSVLYLMAQGMSKAEIIAQLKIANSTLDSHRRNINMKLMGTGIKIDDLKRLSPTLFKHLLELQGKV